jgi:hypothetical protein
MCVAARDRKKRRENKIAGVMSRIFCILWRRGGDDNEGENVRVERIYAI